MIACLLKIQTLLVLTLSTEFKIRLFAFTLAFWGLEFDFYYEVQISNNRIRSKVYLMTLNMIRLVLGYIFYFLQIRFFSKTENEDWKSPFSHLSKPKINFRLKISSWILKRKWNSHKHYNKYSIIHYNIFFFVFT